MGLLRRKNSPSVAQLKIKASSSMDHVIQLFSLLVADLRGLVEDTRDGVTIELIVDGKVVPIGLRIVPSEEDD